MPNRDGKGPEGNGPLTGRMMGNCQGAKPMRRGMGPCGRGLQRGFISRRLPAKNSGD